MSNGFIDIGANLAHPSFHHDLDAVLARAFAAGVNQIILTGSCRSSNTQVAQIAARYPDQVFTTAGVHPHHARDWHPQIDGDLIQQLAQQPQLVSLGECGLDYYRDLSPRQVQRTALIAQLELAIQLKKPVFLHQRDAHDDFYVILKEYRPQLINACVHCFTDTAEALADYLALDCYIGITGWVCDPKRGTALRAVVSDIPDARLMIETDAPYLLPHNMPRSAKPPSGHKTGNDSRRNEPGFLPFVAKALAGLRGQSLDDIAGHSSANAQRFFRLPNPVGFNHLVK